MCSKVNTNIYIKSELIITVPIESHQTLLARKGKLGRQPSSKQKRLRKAMNMFLF